MEDQELAGSFGQCTMRRMHSVTTTWFFMTDARATDRSVTPTWTLPPVTSSQPQPFKYQPAAQAR